MPIRTVVRQNHRPAIASIVLAASLLAGACASTGGVPHPFPVPTARGAQKTHGSKGSEGAQGSEGSQGSPDASTSIERRALVDTALSLRGVPYRNGGTDPKGFDCSGFTQYVFAQHGVALARGVRDQFEQGISVSSRKMSPGDLVFFRTTGAGATHVGVVVNGDWFVHAPSSTGVVRVERLSASYWSARFLGARRVG